MVQYQGRIRHPHSKPFGLKSFGQTPLTRAPKKGRKKSHISEQACVVSRDVTPLHYF